jgi:hypothetical protein
MGWFREGFDKHEGYVVGFVERKRGREKLNGLYRELQYPNDEKLIEKLPVIACGCDCGWRSSHWYPRVTQPASWGPFSVNASEYDDKRAFEEWDRHLSGLRVEERSRRA